MKTFNEVTKLIEKSIENHDLAKLKDAVQDCEESIYAQVGYAGPLFYAAEQDFTEGVEFLLNSYYQIMFLRPGEIDRLWKTALFGSPKKGKSIVMLLLEFKLLPSESFLCSMSLEIRKEKEKTRDNIVSCLKKEMPEVEIITYYYDTDTICIREKEEMKSNP